MPIPDEFKKLYERQGYRFVGKNQHSAVKTCRWTKESLRRGRNCFKRWYGVESHRCLQCTVSLFCLNRCLYCWRTFHPFFEQSMENMKIDEPSEIIEELINQQRLLLTGFKGNPNIDRKKFEEAQFPNNAALSLIGESLFYPKISSLLEEFHKRNFTTFLLTKGIIPEKIKSLEVEPTNFYISLCAPDEETFLKVDNPLISKAWERQMESLELMKGFSCRKVIRLTLVKDLNLKDPEKYAKLILKVEPDFYEVKSFMHVGEAQKRLPRETMPSMEDIRKFAQELSLHTGYKIKDEDVASRVVLLSSI